MKYLKRFFELHSLEEEDDSVKNVADDVFNKIQDKLSEEDIDISFRIVVKKNKAKIMAADGWSYVLHILFKLSSNRTVNHRYIDEMAREVAQTSRKRFNIPIKYVVCIGSDFIDTYIYSRSYTNYVFQGQTYDSNIIYDEKSDSYIEDVINESHIEDEILKFVYDLDKIKVQLDEMSDEGSGYDLSYDWDESKNRIVIDFGFCGYSDGFSQVMTIEKLRSLGQIKVHISESSSSPYGSYEDDKIVEFDSFDDVIQDIKDNFGL